MDTYTHNPQSATLRPEGLSNHPQAISSRSRRDYLRSYQRTWMAKRRAEWIAYNGPCAKRGAHDRLEVDHINPEDKQINPRSLWSMSPKNPRRIAELAKCQVLCHGCHIAKTRPQLAQKATAESLSRQRDIQGRWL